MSRQPPAAAIKDSVGVKRRGRQRSALAGSAGILVKDQIVQICRGVCVVCHGLLLSWKAGPPEGGLGASPKRLPDSIFRILQKMCLIFLTAAKKLSKMYAVSLPRPIFMPM